MMAFVFLFLLTVQVWLVSVFNKYDLGADATKAVSARVTRIDDLCVLAWLASWVAWHVYLGRKISNIWRAAAETRQSHEDKVQVQVQRSSRSYTPEPSQKALKVTLAKTPQTKVA